jgi:hypothetical protein
VLTVAYPVTGAVVGPPIWSEVLLEQIGVLPPRNMVADLLDLLVH